MIIINYNYSRSISNNITCPNYKLVKQLVQISTTENIANLNYATIAINIEICTRKEITALNKLYRGKNRPTNIISLEYSVENNYLTGDIFLCHDIIKIEAKQQQKKIIDHYCHLIVHGLLHLQGFDHVQENDAEEMELNEKKILKQFGIKDPYL